MFNGKNEQKKTTNSSFRGAPIFYNFCKPLTECNFWLGCTSLSRKKSHQRGFVSLL